MITDNVSEQLSIYINRILEAESEGDVTSIVSEIDDALVPEQFALILEAIPADFRLSAWQAVSRENQHLVFISLGSHTRSWIINSLEDEDCYQILAQLDAEDLLEIAEEIPDRFVEYAVNQLDSKERGLYEQAKEYELEQIGHRLDFDFIKISKLTKISSAKKLLKKGLKPFTDDIYIVDKQNKLVKLLNVNTLLASGEEGELTELYDDEVVALLGEENLYEAADKVIMSDKMALPVVNTVGEFIGRVTIDSAYKIKQEQQQEQMNLAGGLTDEEDLFSSVSKSARNRGVWLGINLATAFVASWFIGLFEATLQEIVALAVLMPVVASMGGIAGSQTLTVIVRGLALGQITTANQKALLTKELKVGVINGLIWSLIIAIITYFWFGNVLLSFTILLAILLNLVAAACSGVIIPSVLNRLNIDPALSGAVVLTTVTDIVGFVVFLGLGSILLL